MPRFSSIRKCRQNNPIGFKRKLIGKMEDTRKVATIFDGVKVINFPYTEEDGEKLYPLLSGVVVENIIEQIPERIRPAIILDYAKIPSSYFEEERERIRKVRGGKKMTPEELEAAEQKLIEIFFGEKAEKAPAE